MSGHEHDVHVVCLSDLHLGEEDSLLTALEPGSDRCDVRRPSPVLEQLVACLRDLVGRNRGPRPVLVLAGDVLELAFGSFTQALLCFERFLELVIPPGRELVSEIVYVPGNHDHHVWEIARETRFVQRVLASVEPGAPSAEVHATPLFDHDGIPSFTLSTVARRVRGVGPGDPLDRPIHVVYPNLGFLDPGSDRCLVVHHGHYAERLYHLLSEALGWLDPDRSRPETVDRIEAENFAWIDFVWSLLGRSGEAGEDVEEIYKRLLDPGTRARFLDRLSERIATSVDVPLVPGDRLEQAVIRLGLGRVAGTVSGPRSDRGPDPWAEIGPGLERYVFGPTLRQLRDELGRVPRELAFAFGHTHKPFERSVGDERAGERVEVYNTGGWTVDSVEPAPAVGGAVLVASPGLRAASIRVYGEAGAAAGYPVEVRTAGADPGAEAFRAAIEERITGSGGGPDDPWAELARRIGQQIDRRRAILAHRFAS